LEALEALEKCYKGGAALNTVICLQSVKDDYFLQRLQNIGITVYTWQSVKEKGRKALRACEPVKPETIYTFSYTSGTTGNPKGAMLSHQNIISAMTAMKFTDLQLFPTDVHLSYLPLPHVFERIASLAITYSGASIYYYGGDVLKLKEDLVYVKPTFFISVPRLYNKFYDLMKTNLDKLTGAKKFLVDHAISTKLENLRNKNEYTHKIYDSLVFEKIKQVFGGRVRIMITASAPISKEVKG
jgi:long-chain acyl-CoA synthetase